MVTHIKKSHANHINLADMQLCQLTNIHACPQYPCAVFSSTNALTQHHKDHHIDTRVVTNTSLYTNHLQGSQNLSYTAIWPDALKLIDAHITPGSASFHTGLHVEINDRLRGEFDDIFMGIVHAFNHGLQTYVGSDTYSWNKEVYSFL